MFAVTNSNIPRGWALCNGQTLSIAQNQALFSILGTTYGGNGVNTFQLPNLQGCSPVGTGPKNALGQNGGELTHQLTAPEMPTHIHTVAASTGVGSTPQSSPTNGLWQTNADKKLYGIPSTADTTMAPAALAATGANQPHDNMQPYLTINFMIALQGIYPSRN
jgi:microcystin-dependent protein